MANKRERDEILSSDAQMSPVDVIEPNTLKEPSPKLQAISSPGTLPLRKVQRTKTKPRQGSAMVSTSAARAQELRMPRSSDTAARTVQTPEPSTSHATTGQRATAGFGEYGSANINVTAWDEVSNRIYDTVKVGECFKFTLFRIKEPNPQYEITDHNYELTLTKWTTMTELPDDTLRPLRTDLRTIIELRRKEPDTMVDVIAVVFEMEPLRFINCQDGRTRKKRNVTLVDGTSKLITLDLWPDFTDVLNDHEGRAIMFQNLQLSEYNEKPVSSSTTNTIINVNSQNETVHHVNVWFSEVRCRTEYEELN